MIPQDFESWRDCIVHKCGIPLTQEFALKRLTVYTQTDHPETVEFVRLYGDEHRRRVISWFSRIAENTKN